MLGMLKSTIFSKIVVAVTGAGMVLFIIGHTLSNLLVFLGPGPINDYAAGLREFPTLLWIARILLIVGVLLHIGYSIVLNKRNKTAKGNYEKRNYRESTFAGRFMVYAGLMIFFFLLYHLAHFTFGWTHPDHFKLVDELGRHDVYSMVILGFKQPLISIFYIIAVIFLGLHLSHGVQSMFQTLGIYGEKFTPVMQKIARAFAILIVVSLCSIPITILAGLVGGNV